MVQWWPSAFLVKPWNTWFWAGIPVQAWGWPGTYQLTLFYWFYRIPADEFHREQLAIKSPVDRNNDAEIAAGLTTIRTSLKANVIYILTYPGDLPNWGGASAGTIAPPCGNWYTTIYEIPSEVTRSQTYSIQAAVQSNRQKTATIRAAIALTASLDCSIVAAVQGNPELPVSSLAAIQGDRQLPVPMRAAVRTERLLEWNMIAAVGKDFELPSSVVAAVQGNPQKYHGMRAACKGEAEKRVGIIAFVVKSRVDTIYLEFENKWPQEFGFTTIQNAPSETKDYRKQGIS
jgi:hypothetical protein